ncbi:hypothetical protein E2C01_041959 [Portunus trituberculatus]|uniref:Uncharacterized protein n=1 Tax=Portunus trituberculatus TaxID=210409 RepID=A0A5B7FKJ1_PORTR|nr:hypothetical protein [Portunus trituberculatus]
MFDGLWSSPTPRAEEIRRQTQEVQVSSEPGMTQAEVGDGCSGLRPFPSPAAHYPISGVLDDLAAVRAPTIELMIIGKLTQGSLPGKRSYAFPWSAAAVYSPINLVHRATASSGFENYAVVNVDCFGKKADCFSKHLKHFRVVNLCEYAIGFGF